MLPLLAERGEYPIILGDKGYISQHLQTELIETEGTVLLPTLKRNQKQQYPESFRKLQVRMRRRIETTIGSTHRAVSCFSGACLEALGFTDAYEQ